MKPRIFPLFASTVRGFRASSAFAFTVISAALAGTHVMADTSFTTGFDGPALDASLETTYSGSGSLAVGGTAVTTENTYVGTVESDYAVSTNNWTATIEVQGSGNRYFGLGTGVSSGQGDPGYGTPQGLSGEAAAYTMMYSAAFFDGGDRSVQTQRKLSSANYWTGETNYNDAAFDAAVGTTGGVSDTAFYRYTMAYDSAAQTLTFDVDEISGFGGTVTSSGAGNFGVMSLAGMGFTASTGKIFFGGEGTFDNLSVNVTTPPPITSGTWTNTAGGQWGTTGNWLSNLVATGTGSTADFNTLNLTADTTVDLDSARTIGNLIFGDTDTSSAAGWTLTGSALTLSGITPTITVNALGVTKTATISAEVAGAAGLTKSGDGTLTLSAANTYTGATTISAGTLQLGNGGTTGSLSTSSAIINTSNLTINRSNAVVQGTDFSGSAITGIGSLTMAGAGTLTLAGTNTYSGGTTVSEGTLIAGGGATGMGAVTIASGATLSTTSASSNGLAALYYNNSPVQANFASLPALLAHFGPNSPTPSQVNTATSMNFGAFGSGFPSPYNSGAIGFEALYSGKINITTSGTYTFNTSSDDGSMIFIDGHVVVTNNFDQGYPGSTKSGSIALTAGMHDIVIAYNQGGGGYGMNAQISGADDTNMVDINTGNASITPDLVVGSLAGAGNVTLTTGNLITGIDDSSTSFSGTISGIGSVTKFGTGVQTLTGTLSYGGSTSVQGGTLSIGNGVSPTTLSDSATVSIASGATMNLNFTGSDTVGALEIAGSGPLPADTYNSSHPIYGSYFTGSGSLVVPVTATPYEIWATSFDPDIGLPAEDDDNDGLTNFEEYAFGLLPNNGASVNPIASQLDKSTKKFSYTRRTGSGLTYSVWFSENLNGWTEDIGATEGTPVPSGDNETVEVTLSALPGNPLPAKLFIQVRAD